MQAAPRNQPPEENVFGASDGTSYSAVLTHDGQGRVTIDSLLVDGHNMPLRDASFATRGQAVAAIEEYARGDRKP